ncbi:MAG: hypothetical protein ABSD20_05580 [Terriglobales bacterium]
MNDRLKGIVQLRNFSNMLTCTILVRSAIPDTHMSPIDYHHQQDNLDSGAGCNRSFPRLRLMRRLVVLTEALMLIAAIGIAAAQTGQQQSGTSGGRQSVQNAAAHPPEPKPSQQITKLLQAFAGTWSIKEKLAPDAASPNGAKGAGKIVWAAGPGGYSVVENYRSKEDGRTITGLGVFWWDEAAQGYRTMWCDSTNPGGCINFKNVAKWDGSHLVLIEPYEVNGKKVVFKEVFSDITPTAFTQTLYGGEEGGELKIDQTIRATKLAGAGPGKEPQK